MTPNNNLSVLAWYTDIKYQNHRKFQSFDTIYPLITPARFLLPFQIIRPTRFQPVSIVNLYKASGQFFANITNAIKDVGLVVKKFENEGFDVIVHPGILPMPIDMPEGNYYATITDGVQTWYSEVFTMVSDISKYLRIVWYDKEDLAFDDGKIVYNDPNFKNVLYIDTLIGKPEYPFEEEGENRDGRFFAVKQISEKTYKFNFLAPEYLCDALRIVRMADFVRVYSDGQIYDCDTFLASVKWETQGDLANVSVEFECNTIVKKNGKGYVPEDIGDFDEGDYNFDFDDIEGTPNPCNISVSASETTIDEGDSTVLSYTGCVGGVVTWDHSVGTGNNKTVSPTVTTTYTASCVPAGGGTPCTASITIIVNPTDPSNPCSLVASASSTNINAGESTLLTYTGCAGGVVTWNNGVGTGNNKTVFPAVTTTYIASCAPSGGGSPCTSNITITVVPVDPGPGPDGFTDWEINQLPAYINGENDVTQPNTLAFEVLDGNGNPNANFVSKHIWADGHELLNTGSGDTPPIALVKGLADGFDNCFLHSATGLAAANRFKWTLPGLGDPDSFTFWSQTHAQLETAGGNYWGYLKSQCRTPSGTTILFRFTMLDIEAGVTDFSKMEYFIRGYYNAARAEVADHIVIVYGYRPNNGFTYWHNGYSYDGDSVPEIQKFFPYSKHSYNETKAKVSAGIITNWFKGKDVWYNILVSYAKVDLPLTTSMYQKDSSGNILLDTDGQRLFRADYFSETMRGIDLRWDPAGTPDQISPSEQNEYGIYRLKSEVYHAGHQMAGHYSELFFRLRMLSNMLGLGDDIQNMFNQPSFYGTCGIMRQDLEANPFKNIYRPVDRVTTDYYAGMIFTLLNHYSWYTGFTGGNIGLTLNGFWDPTGTTFFAGSNQTVNEGVDFPQPWFGDMDMSKRGHLGNYRQVAARYRQMQAENRVCNLWQKSDKILTLCHPEQIINGQFPIMGRLNGKYLKLHGLEARLDIGESFNIIIKNTKNATIFNRQIVAKRVFNELIVLPDGVYNAEDIYVEYNNPVKPGVKRVNGKAESL